MRRAALALLVLVSFVACPAEMWIPLQAAPRTPVPLERVQYLQAPPDRPYLEIGIITPPEDEYDTDAEMVKAIRQEAAKHGADAIFIESQDERAGWHFSAGAFGGSGGSGTMMKVRAKAIVWK